MRKDCFKPTALFSPLAPPPLSVPLSYSSLLFLSFPSPNPFSFYYFVCSSYPLPTPLTPCTLLTLRFLPTPRPLLQPPALSPLAP